MQTEFRNLKRWPFATVMSARKYGYDNIFAPKDAHPGSKLCMAILRGDNSEVRAMLDNGAPLNFRDEPDGWTPLIYSIYYRNQQACDWLLERGAAPECGDFSGRTPLMVAAIVGDLPLVERLLRLGARPDTADCHRRSALDFALEFHHRDCAAALYAAIAATGAEK